MSPTSYQTALLRESKKPHTKYILVYLKERNTICKKIGYFKIEILNLLNRIYLINLRLILIINY